MIRSAPSQPQIEVVPVKEEPGTFVVKHALDNPLGYFEVASWRYEQFPPRDSHQGLVATGAAVGQQTTE